MGLRLDELQEHGVDGVDITCEDETDTPVGLVLVDDSLGDILTFFSSQLRLRVPCFVRERNVGTGE